MKNVAMKVVATRKFGNTAKILVNYCIYVDKKKTPWQSIITSWETKRPLNIPQKHNCFRTIFDKYLLWTCLVRHTRFLIFSLLDECNRRSKCIFACSTKMVHPFRIVHPVFTLVKQHWTRTIGWTDFASFHNRQGFFTCLMHFQKKI